MVAPGVSVASNDARVVGSVLNSVFVAPSSPIANGYGAGLPVMSANGMVFNVSNTLARQGGRMLMDPYEHRPTGRGGPDDSDITQGRQVAEPEVLPKLCEKVYCEFKVSPVSKRRPSETCSAL